MSDTIIKLANFQPFMSSPSRLTFCTDEVPPADAEIFHIDGLQVLDAEVPTGNFLTCAANVRTGSVTPIGYCEDCLGHLSREEALEHYRQFLLDKHLNLQCRSGIAAPCMVCCEETTVIARIWIEYRDSWPFPLCAQHRKKAIVDRLFYFESFTGLWWPFEPASFPDDDRVLRLKI